MAKLIKIKPLDEYAKLDVVKSAKKDALFLVIPKSAIKGRDKDGHIILDKSADVSEDIRKEDMDASGYGQDSGDQMSDDDASNWPSKEDAMTHAKNLDKCKGAIMKGAGITSLEDDDNLEGGGGEDARREGESEDAFKTRRAAFTKSKVATLLKRLDDVPALVEAAVAKALEGKGGDTQPVPRKEGTLVEKTASQGSGSGDGKDERTLKTERLDSLKAERSAFIEKMNAKIALSGEDMMRKTKVSEEIMLLETELMARR